jgi:hypothetical protein
MVIWDICGHLVYFMVICGHLVYFVVIWYIFHRFGMLYQEKSGNPGFNPSRSLLQALHPSLFKQGDPEDEAPDGNQDKKFWIRLTFFNLSRFLFDLRFLFKRE